MTNKSYISMLTKKDFEELEKAVIGIDKFDTSQTIISKDKRNDSVDVVFWEWVDDEEAEEGGYYVETRYKYHSFEPPECYDVCINYKEQRNVSKRFFEWMFQKFGKEYLKSYVYYETGAELNDI